MDNQVEKHMQMKKYELSMKEIEEKRKSRQERLSKRLSWLLRHGAAEEDLDITPDGYIYMEDIAGHKHFKDSFTVQVLKDIVQNDHTKRYTIKQDPITGALMIRANYGHSLRVMTDDKCVKRVTSLDEVPVAIYATSYLMWSNIKRNGLKSLTRTHICFATNEDLLMENGVKAFKDDYDILIYLNLASVLEDGKMKLYLTEKNLLVCCGLPNGTIPSYFFAKVVDRVSGRSLKY